MAATEMGSRTVAGRARPWRAALRRHRTGMFVSLGILVLLGIGLAVAAAVLPDCDSPPGATGAGFCDAARSAQRLSMLLVQALVGGPVAMGILLGTLLFAREFEQRTHVVALTQQQDRLQWWAVSVLTVAGPLFVGWLLLGLGAGLLSDSRSGAFNLFIGRNWMDFPFFEITGAGPALAFLISFSLAASIGVLVRTTVLTVVTAGLLSVLAVVGLLLLRPHLVPAERISAPVGQDPVTVVDDRFPPGEPGAWYRGTGMLDGSGEEIVPDFEDPSCTVGRDGLELEALQDFYDACYRAQGIVETYVVVIAPDQLNRMRWTVGGIEILLSAVGLGAGVLVLRRRDL